MARTKKKNVKIRKRKPVVTWARISTAIGSKWFTNLMLSLIIALLVSVLVYLIVDYCRKAEIFMIQIEAPATEEWIDRKEVDAFVRNDEFLARKHSAFEDGLCRAVAARFETQCWVKRVVNVRHSWPGEMVVELEYREPVILVEDRYLADIDGVCLQDCLGDEPKFYAEDVDKRLLPVRNYVGELAVGAGGRWQGRAIQAAAEVAERIEPLRQWVAQNGGDGILWINVEGFGVDGIPDIQIVTKNGKIIEWGHAAAETDPNEADQQAKLDGLWKIYREHPRLDYYYPNGEGRIIIQWDPQKPTYE